MIQINKIRNEKVETKTNTNKIQGIIRDYFQNLYSNISEDLEEMYKSLDTYDPSKLKQEDINHLYRSIISNQIEVAMKSLPKKNSPEHNGFSNEFCQHSSSTSTTWKGKEDCQRHSMKSAIHSSQNQTRT
jgi:glutamyl-tRNA reductase